jgi:hypothetical protein
MTRTVIMAAATVRDARFTPRWSPRVEAEADRHARPGQAKLAEVRNRWWGADMLTASADAAQMASMVDTDPKDRHVLAAAHGSGISLIVSRNVADFGRRDLEHLGVSVAHPDLFLATMVPAMEYAAALSEICSRRSRPPNTPEALHAALGRHHPLLFAAMAGVFPGVAPLARNDADGAEVFRGTVCLGCGARLADAESLVRGIGPECRSGAQPCSAH